MLKELQLHHKKGIIGIIQQLELSLVYLLNMYKNQFPFHSRPNFTLYLSPPGGGPQMSTWNFIAFSAIFWWNSAICNSRLERFAKWFGLSSCWRLIGAATRTNRWHYADISIRYHLNHRHMRAYAEPSVGSCRWWWAAELAKSGIH